MASSTQDLDQFVREALAKGESKQDIESALALAGWQSEQARSALNAYSDVRFSVPVPKPRPYLSVREAFLYLTLFTTLYLAAFSLGQLLFNLIGLAFPDPADIVNDAWVRQAMRWPVATLIISFPVFLFLSHYLGKELARSPVKRLSPVRRWLTYLTLFVAATVVLADLIALVYNMLGGELTTRFVLKVLVAGVIAGTIFGYYLWDLHKEEKEE